MSKKNFIQLFVSIIFFSITFYVMYGFFNTTDEVDKNSQTENGDVAGRDLEITNLLNRQFLIKQIDIFEKDTFKELEDNSVEIPTVKGTSVGKKDPFGSVE